MRISDWSSGRVLVRSLRRHAVDGALFEREVDERILEPHRLLASVDDIFLDGLRETAALLGERVEELDDTLAVEAFVADRPADDLAHALHLVEAREVHQHCEAREKLKPFGEAAEHSERARDIFIAIDAEGVQIVDRKSTRLNSSN